MLKIVDKSILECSENYLCHQTNCVSKRVAGLAKLLFKKFPYADCYRDRDKPSEPGTIIIRKKEKSPTIINMMGQYYPGPAMTEDPKIQADNRFEYFRQCLGKMMGLKGNFAFPWKIGCGIAQGDWDRYLGLLARFEYAIKGDVVIYRISI